MFNLRPSKKAVRAVWQILCIAAPLLSASCASLPSSSPTSTPSVPQKQARLTQDDAHATSDLSTSAKTSPHANVDSIKEARSARAPQNSSVTSFAGTQKALEYILENERAIRREIAEQAPGQKIEGFCSLMGVKTGPCKDRLNLVDKDRNEVLKTPHGLGLYRSLRSRLLSAK